ncbi:hypothetical protein BDV30DRAFT_207079 [Aspergillus minisclerotigenes]|uniref:Uncharacterized protein n=1 Tax=Aspergillus minisclerotigenes TaxID=656917 RepID=A0A5N6JAS4_9EURO|nr:hypothetical protein BDV30DRAFT_207079 [Aspergillus minisclerotigenes]
MSTSRWADDEFLLPIPRPRSIFMISYSICRGHLRRQPHFLSVYIGLAISWTFSSIMGLESLVQYFLFEVSNAPLTKWVL